MTMPKTFRQIVDDFYLLGDWEDRYRYVIELGQALPGVAESERVDSNKIHGCVSQVWLVPAAEEHDGDVVVSFRGESDAMIVRGLLAILLALYSGRTAAQIVETDAFEAFDRLGLREHLTTQRSNGLTAMIERMQSAARERQSPA